MEPRKHGHWEKGHDTGWGSLKHTPAISMRGGLLRHKLKKTVKVPGRTFYRENSPDKHLNCQLCLYTLTREKNGLKISRKMPVLTED